MDLSKRTLQYGRCRSGGRHAGAWLRGLLSCAFTLAALGCTPAQKRPVVATALDDTEMRRESFEATLRVLDEHPEYVDELFAQALRHPKTLDRLLQNTAHGLRDEELARRAATQLVAVPEGLRMTLVATLIAMDNRQPALVATAAAIEERSDVTVQAMVQRESTVRRTVRALVEEMQHNPEARRMFLAALRENSDGMARVLTADPDVLAVLFKSISKVGLRRGSDEFQDFLSQFAE